MSTDDQDMYLFTSGDGQTPNFSEGQTFDDNFLDTSSGGVEDAMTSDFLSPANLMVKQEYQSSPRVDHMYNRGSTSSSSSGSSSTSPHHNRNVSTATTTSPAISKTDSWTAGINGVSMPINEHIYEDSGMMGSDQDMDQQMAAAFDFDTAASTPNAFDTSVLSAQPKMFVGNQPLRHTQTMPAMNNHKNSSPHVTAAPASFFLGSREASPLGSMLPTSQAPSPWHKNSPSSGLEETFNHMGMNGDSPGNATFSPAVHMNYGDASFSFAPDSTGTPSTFAKDMSSPPSTIHTVHSHQSMDGRPLLHVYPTSLKSRVETQIPIRMTLYPLPAGVRKLRLPTHTVSKPKFLAKPEFEKSPDTLELHVSLVCTSAMQDPHRKQRALARARGLDAAAYSRPSPASSTGSTSSVSREDDEKPLNGGEVKICSGCIQRERKRASRKKQKKPEEEELFQKDEEKRVVVFNTNEIKEWTEITKDTALPNDQSQPSPPPGTVQVELPMRIACYCRHQNEKLGFMVIFTITDHKDRFVAQAMTNSIMITDDHKTHNAPHPLTTAPQPQMVQQPVFPGSAAFQTGSEMPLNEQSGAKLFKQSYSTPDLTRLQNSFASQFNAPTTTPFAMPQAVSGNTSATLTPRNLSRPASPSGPNGPASKRRKPSGSGKLPSGLTMTRLDTIQAQPAGPATMPNTAASSPYAPNMPTFASGTDTRNFQPPVSHRAFNSPPTPGGDGTFGSSINRSFSLENLPRQAALMSAPSSRQPSRPSSPLAVMQHNYHQNDGSFGNAVSQQLMNQSNRRPPPVIHKLVPNEGSVSGGTEVTLLGNGFYQGLEVMFGDTEATTTTYWGEKCLNCIAPPAAQAGIVTVMFKHEHPHYATLPGPSHARQTVFTYIDDNEIEMLRLALRTIGKQMGTDDPYMAAQQLLQQNQANGNGMYAQQGYGNMNGGHQRNASSQSREFSVQEMEKSLLQMLQTAKRRSGLPPVQLDLKRPTGLSLLHYAASLGMAVLAKALIASGSDVNSLDNNGFTPMHHAAMRGHENVINHLRAAGADHRARSLKSFIPADLATTLKAYQATMRPYQHSRLRSSGEMSGSLGHNDSSKSLSSLWENASSLITDSESEVPEDDSSTRPVSAHNHKMPFVQPLPASVKVSRRSSRQDIASAAAAVGLSNASPIDGSTTPPSTLVGVWRQLVNMTQAQQAQFVEQFHHIQHNMPALPQLERGVMRRMSSLFPRAANNSDAPQVLPEGASPGLSAPPAYDELFPAQSEPGPDKKETASAIQAAAEAALDHHYEREDANLQLNISSSDQKEQPAVSGARRLGISQDRRLFFFWIPLLLILIGLMLPKSPLVSVMSAATNRYASPRLVPVA